MVHVPSIVSDEEFMPWLLKPDLHDVRSFHVTFSSTINYPLNC